MVIPCETVWGHVGQVPGYSSQNYTDTGHRTVAVFTATVFGLAEPETHAADQALVDAAVYAMLGKPIPTATMPPSIDVTNSDILLQGSITIIAGPIRKLLPKPLKCTSNTVQVHPFRTGASARETFLDRRPPHRLQRSYRWSSAPDRPARSMRNWLSM